MICVTHFLLLQTIVEVSFNAFCLPEDLFSGAVGARREVGTVGLFGNLETRNSISESWQGRWGIAKIWGIRGCVFEFSRGP